MSSEEVRVVAIITPAEGKEARVRELLTKLAKDVEANEKDVVSKYLVSEQDNAKDGKNVFVVQELYKNQAAYEAHSQTSYFQATVKIVGEEGLFGAPLDIKTIKPFAGF